MIKPLFIPTLNSGVTYWRMMNFVQAAHRNRIMPAHILWWQKDLNENHPWQFDITSPEYRARIFGELDYASRIANVVVMGMIHTPAGLNLLQSIREAYGIPVVVEMDDNILSTPTYNPASEAYDPRSVYRKLCISQLREADALIVSTPYLKEIYSEFNDNIYVVPNSIDFSLWGKVRRKPAKGKVVVGWAGGASHNDDLAIIIPAVEHITKRYPNVEFRIIHGASPSLRNMQGVKWIEKFVRMDKYPQHIASQGFDIGMAPLVDNAFNRGKSNLRWLEYSALGIPTVASRVGNFVETIKDGQDAILCNDSQDFIDNLELLIKNKEIRREMGRQAYKRVFEDFNVDKTTEGYAKILEDIISRGQIKRATPKYKTSSHTTEAITEIP